MTIIVGYKTKKGLLFASDTQCSSDEERGMDTIEKVFEKNGVIYGIAGSININNELRYNFNYKFSDINDKHELFGNFRTTLKNFLRTSDNCLNEQNELDGQILFGVNNNIYAFQCDLSITECMKNYYCVGSGSSYALGSLYTTHTLSNIPVRKKLKLAIESAGEFSMGCNKEVKIYDYTN